LAYYLKYLSGSENSSYYTFVYKNFNYQYTLIFNFKALLLISNWLLGWNICLTLWWN